jgi:hypothetical protein
MQSFVRDLRYVGRAALRTPGFFIVTVLTLALVIGATTAIFTVINGVLLEPLPYPNPERLVQLWQVGEEGGQGQGGGALEKPAAGQRHRRGRRGGGWG